MDGGNSFFRDTIRREKEVAEKVTSSVPGISGGDGALTGPSIAPGGTPESYQILGLMLEVISAHARRRALLRVRMGTGRRRPLRQDDPQRHEYSMAASTGEAYELLKAAGISNETCRDLQAGTR